MKQSDPKQAQRVPLGQILLDDVFLLLLVGLVVPFIIYTVWGLMDIGAIKPLPEAPISGTSVNHGQTQAPPIDGARLAQSNGCVGCHTADGSTGVGPSWKGLFGSSRALADGSTVVADEAYLRQSILEPGARVAAGFSNGIMPPYAGRLSGAELEALIAYIQSLK